MMRPRPQSSFSGSSVLKLLSFGDNLSLPTNQQMQNGRMYGNQMPARNQSGDLTYWQQFVERFYSPTGVLRQQLWCSTENSTKQYEIATPALARYYWTHFVSGVQNIQMILEQAKEKDLQNGGHFVESNKSCFVYWLENGHQVSI